MARFLPYDEFKIVRDEDRFVVNLPWLQTVVSCEGLEPETLSRIDDAFNDRCGEPDAQLLRDTVLQALAKLPVAYALPRTDIPLKLDPAPWRTMPAVEADPRSFLLDLGVQLLDPDFGLYADRHYRSKGWQFDLDSALALSRVKDSSFFDPITVLTILRRFNLLTSLESNKTNELFDLLSKEKGVEFREFAALILRQNHYVTQQCWNALSPARELAGPARPLVERFLSSERGHDRILSSSISHLGCDVDKVPILLEMRVLMKLCLHIASNDFLAFCLTVDCFERPHFSSEYPLVKLLREKGYPEAAAALSLHDEINEQGEHASVSLDFLAKRGLATAADVKNSFRLAELISDNHSMMSQAILQLRAESDQQT